MVGTTPTDLSSLNARWRHARRSGNVEMVGIKEDVGRAEVDMVRERVRVRVFARFMTTGGAIQGNIYLNRSDSSWGM